MAQIQPAVEVSRFVTDQPDTQLHPFTAPRAHAQGTVFDIGGSKLSLTLGPLLEEKLFALTGRQLIKADGTRQRLLPSALLSDDTGLSLWREINRLPDYYQTRDEIDLFAKFGAHIAQLVPDNATLIDLGAGDVRKVQPFLDALELARKPILYLALDLSRSSLESGMAELAPRYHHVQCFGLWGSFNDDLGWMDYLTGPRWLLSLGSILGNDWHSGAVFGLSRFAQRLHSEDRMLLGMDSCKNRATIWQSYHDKQGIFEQFMRNGLERANDIVGCHWYRPEDWAIEGAWNEDPVMHFFQITALRDVVVDKLGVKLVQGTRLDCYEAFKYEPREMQQTFADSGMDLLYTWTSPSKRIAASMDALVLSEANAQGAADRASQDEPPLDHSTTGEGENKFQRAISAWRNIDLSALMPKLDSTASDLVAQQRDALLERKELAQKTKDFRKLEDSAKLTEYKTLLKSYQTFIDLITTHGKTSSSAFLQVYQSLSDAPDPFPLLEASVDSLVASEDTVPKLTTENQQLLTTVNKLSAQLEETEKRLQDECKARRDAETGTGSRVQEIEAKWEKVLEEKQSNWAAKEQALEEKVENQDRLLKELKASYEVSQRLNDGSAEQASSKAAHAELEMTTLELEKTSARMAELEARNEQLSVELARATSQSARSHEVEDDPSFLRLQSENSSLLRKIDSTRFERDTEKRELDNKIRHAERQRQQLSSENEELRAKVHLWSDYEDLKRELETLRSIELSIGDEEDGDEANANGAADPSSKQPLEQLLLARNKKLSNELTLLRVSHQDIQQQLEDLQEELSRTNAELEKSQKLSSTLENDLVRIQEEAANVLPSSGMSVAGTYISRHPTGSLRRGRGSPTSSIISGYDSLARSSTLESLRAGEPVGGGSGILPMVQAQRDRFKQKNQQLEEELSKTYATVTSLRQEVASLQKDNLNLYEKSRYVSAYSRGPTTSSANSYSRGTGHTSLMSTDEDGTNDRWKAQYEANISPFAAFRGRETARAFKRMSLPERMIFSLTRIVLSTRTSRNLFAGYCLALHILVFLMLYWMGSTDVERHAPHLGEAVAAVAGAGGAGSQSPEWHEEDFG